MRRQAGAAWIAGLALSCASAVCTAGGPDRAAAPAVEQAVPDGLDQLLRLLATRRHGHVQFTEVQRLAMLDRPLESSGELSYDAPDRLEKRTLKPKAEDLLLEHGVVSVTRGRRTRSFELAAYPQVAPLIESIRATLAGDRAALERTFTVRFEGDLARWTLVLVPRDAAAARTVREVRIYGEHGALQTVEVLQPDGDRSLLTLGPELAR